MSPGQRLFISIAPLFPHSKGWTVTYRDKNGTVKGVLSYPDKISLMIDLDHAIPDDDTSIDVNLEQN